jgi:hypothetical protein
MSVTTAGPGAAWARFARRPVALLVAVFLGLGGFGAAAGAALGGIGAASSADGHHVHGPGHHDPELGPHPERRP